MVKKVPQLPAPRWIFQTQDISRTSRAESGSPAADLSGGRSKDVEGSQQGPNKARNRR